MTTLVTGATGFLGSAVARKLVGAGHAVRVLTRAGADTRNIDGLDVERATGDLNDRASLEKAARGCDTLFHVAADYRLWIPDPPRSTAPTSRAPATCSAPPPAQGLRASSTPRASPRLASTPTARRPTRRRR